MHWRAADVTVGAIRGLRRSRRSPAAGQVGRPVRPGGRRTPVRSRQFAALRPLAIVAVVLAALLAGIPEASTGAYAEASTPDRAAAGGAAEMAAADTATAATAPSAAPDSGVRTTLDRVTTTASASAGTVRATGHITNTGDQTLYEVNAAFWISQEPLQSRSAIATAAGERPGERSGTRLADPEFSYDLLDQVTEELEPGETERFKLDIPVEQLGISEAGSYLVGVDVRATPPQQTRQTVSQARTFLPWVPNQRQTSPVEVGVVVPLTAEPAAVDGNTVLDARSLRRFAPDGRLARLLELAQDHDVTWLLDPNVIADAETIADGARTVDGSETSAARKRAADHAQDWLNRASDVLTDENTLLLPYADPDVSSLHRHQVPDRLAAAVETSTSVAERVGLSATVEQDEESAGDTAPTTPEPEDSAEPTRSPETTESAGATETEQSRATQGPNGGEQPGEETAEDGQAGTSDAPQTEPTGVPNPENTLGTPGADELPDPEHSRVIGWPGTGYADSELLSSMAEHDISTAVLADTALPRHPHNGTAPLASVSTAEGAISTLVNDTALTEGGPAGGRKELLARQRMLAETTALSLLPKRPGGQPRRVVMTLPRDFNPDTAGKTVLDSIERTPWLRTGSPTSWLSSSAPKAYGGPLVSPDQLNGEELSAELMSDLTSYETLSTNYTSMLAEPAEIRARMDREFLRSASTSWRGADRHGRRMLSVFQDRIGTAMSKVKVLDPRFVTLSSRSGRFPVSVWNTSDQPVRVIVEAQPRAEGALQIDPQEPITVQPHRKSTVQVDASSASGGAVQVQVSLMTPNGTRFGNSENFAVRSTDYGLVGWVVIGIGLGALFVMVVLRIIRRAHSKRRSGGGSDSSPAPASAAGATADTSGSARSTGAAGAADPTESADATDAADAGSAPPTSSS